jgi:acyl-CoA synthetase (NDP forming)
MAISTSEAVKRILSPTSVVIVGASASPAGMASEPLRNLRTYGYPGEVYLVNPRHKEIDGTRCYASLDDLPAVPDTAVIASPASTVLDALRGCRRMGIETATVVAGGLTEGAAGPEAASSRAEWEATLQETGVRVLGPNTAGLINLSDRYVPRAAAIQPKEFRAGGLAVVGQSGALGINVLHRAALHGVGIHAVVHTGNQEDLDTWDVVRVFADDDRVKVIGVVVEGFKSPEKFRLAASEARRAGKPVILFKLGVTTSGSSVVATHSGALAGDAAVQRAVVASEGVLQVDEIDEIWQVAKLFDHWGLPTAPVANLGIVALSGGEAAIAADAAERSGFELPALSPPTRETLDPLFSFAHVANPFDLTGQYMSNPELIPAALSAISTDKALDALMVILTTVPPSLASRTIEKWITDSEEHSIPIAIAAASVADYSLTRDREYGGGRVPIIEGTGGLLQAMRHYRRFAEFARDREATEVSPPAPAAEDSAPVASVEVHRHGVGPDGVLNYWNAREVLSGLGLPFNEARLASTTAEAVTAVAELGFPVVMKASKASVVHKAEAGGIRGFVTSEPAVAEAASDLLELWGPGAALGNGTGEGVVVETFRPSQFQVIVGARRDSEFGIVIVFGLGGVYAEGIRDVVCIPFPSPGRPIAKMMLDTAVGKTINARKPRVIASIEQHISLLGKWMMAHDDVDSVDLNPLLIGDQGELSYVDARIALRQSSHPTELESKSGGSNV